MTNSFIDYKFLATGASTTRSMPDRLVDTRNVKDYGALGDGTGALLSSRYGSLAAAQVDYPFVTSLSQTIDWAAITGATRATLTAAKGTIFFPPGTYIVSDPIDIGPSNSLVMTLTGVLGLSTIIGDFADYVIAKANPQAGEPCHIACLKVINNNANGGGIRLGGCNEGSIRDCTVVANRGINNSQDDSGSPGATSLDFTIENCQLSPGTNTSGSIGFMLVANGPVFNCRVIGYETGAVMWGQEGNMYFAGCHFEGNLVAAKPAVRPDGVSDNNAGITFTGCHFKNNGIALYVGATTPGFRMTGCRIEADESVMVYGSIPQYGIQTGQDGFFAGVVVEGQFEQYAIAIYDGGQRPQFFGVNAFNTSTMGGLGAWLMPTNSYSGGFFACNCPAFVYTVANLPAPPTPIAAISWSGGTATITVGINVGQYSGQIDLTIVGVTPSGYNGAFTGASVAAFNILTVPMPDPGSPTGTGGTLIINLNHHAQEGDCYNVSDSNTSTWGATTPGGGSTRAKVRWSSDSNWNVVGK